MGFLLEDVWPQEQNAAPPPDNGEVKGETEVSAKVVSYPKTLSVPFFESFWREEDGSQKLSIVFLLVVVYMWFQIHQLRCKVDILQKVR
jgi:hypothetical protein